MSKKYNITKIIDDNQSETIGLIINGKTYMESKHQLYNELLFEIMVSLGPSFVEEYYSKNTKSMSLEDYNKQVTKRLEEKINKNLPNAQQQTKIYNLKTHTNAINNCREEILTGKQIQLSHQHYNVGQNLYATTDIGNRKSNQEDSVLILEHPQNKDFKIIAVSDGVGGAADGEKASNHIVKKLIHWFEDLNPNIYTNITEIQKSLNNMLPTILEDLPSSKEASATLSAAIIGKTETLITNIGDSGVYTMKNGHLTKETTDDSLVQTYFNNGKIPHKELLRYRKDSNVITQAISKEKSPSPNYKIINNETYDKIIAVSDGVSDCLSKQEMETILQRNKPQEAISQLVKGAITNNSTIQNTINTLPKKNQRQVVRHIKEKPEYYQEKIYGGKDNTTAAAFIKK